MSFLSNILGGLFGKSEKKSSTYTKGQRSLIDDILQSVRGMKGGAQDITQSPSYQQGTDWLMQLFNNPEFFSNFEAPLQRQFQEQTVPDLANRFASMGSGGALGSTAFRNQLAREGSNLHSNIANLRGGLQQQGVNQLLGYAQQPFSNLLSLQQQALQPTQNVYQPPSSGLLSPLLSAFAGGASQGLGQQFGNSLSNRFAGQSPLTY